MNVDKIEEDVHSDFSINSEDSDGKDNENILDLRIIEGSFDNDFIEGLLEE